MIKPYFYNPHMWCINIKHSMPSVCFNSTQHNIKPLEIWTQTNKKHMEALGGGSIRWISELPYLLGRTFSGKRAGKLNVTTPLIQLSSTRLWEKWQHLTSMTQTWSPAWTEYEYLGIVHREMLDHLFYFNKITQQCSWYIFVQSYYVNKLIISS